MKLHLLKCAQAWKRVEARTRLFTIFGEWQCRWGSCTVHAFPDPETAATHMSKHMRLDPLQCMWNACTHVAHEALGMHTHLAMMHGTYTEDTIPTQFRFCHECAIWTASDMEWSVHCFGHIVAPDIIYGPVMAEGILAAPRRCPYCMAQGIYLQLESTPSYLQHVEAHIHRARAEPEGLKCPHRLCERRTYESRELKRHLDVVHAIPFLSYV
jgi:hypothetical protein